MKHFLWSLKETSCIFTSSCVPTSFLPLATNWSFVVCLRTFTTFSSTFYVLTQLSKPIHVWILCACCLQDYDFLAPQDDWLGQTVINIHHVRPRSPLWLPISYAPPGPQKPRPHVVIQGWILFEILSGIPDVRT